VDNALASDHPAQFHNQATPFAVGQNHPVAAQTKTVEETDLVLRFHVACDAKAQHTQATAPNKAAKGDGAYITEVFEQHSIAHDDHTKAVDENDDHNSKDHIAYNDDDNHDDDYHNDDNSSVDNHDTAAPAAHTDGASTADHDPAQRQNGVRLTLGGVWHPHDGFAT
jgi:hypothetical protein